MELLTTLTRQCSFVKGDNPKRLAGFFLIVFDIQYIYLFVFNVKYM